MWCYLCGNSSQREMVVHQPGQGRKKSSQDRHLRFQAKSERHSSIIEKYLFGGGGLAVFPGIIEDEHIDLHVLDRGTETGDRYMT
ncbi:hypothetical protein TNCV_1607971 [Trichonephila clavipes]|nr:hypothetical protein TNCV_1607971 [Trichonephila clavipes]